MVLIIGIPNAGKTTFSNRYLNAVHLDRFSGDGRVCDEVVEMVRADNSLVVEGICEKAANRKRLVEVSKAKNTCIWLDTPLDVCIEREETGRRRGTYVIRVISQEFEPPTYAEGWDEIIHITSLGGQPSGAF